MNNTYDSIIIGAGPAGLTAALYAARYKLKCIVFGKIPESAAAGAPWVDNYPGFASIPGAELLSKFADQVAALGIAINEEDVSGMKKRNGMFEVKAGAKNYTAKTLILALGTKRRKLNVLGEDRFLGKGVSYCVTCDGPLFKGKDIAIIGGGDSAVSAALFMLKYAKKIYMIDVEKQPRAKPSDLDLLKKEKKVEFFSSYKVNEIKGDNLVSSMEIEQVEWQGNNLKGTGKKKEIKIQGTIVEIGMIPSSDLVKELGIKLDKGFIIADKEMKTNIPGVFAAGDLRDTPLRQIVTAAGDGAIAAASAYEYLKSK